MKFALVLCFAATVPLAAQLKPIPAPSKTDRATVEWLERSLAHDSMEGRGTAMPGSTKAARFLAGEMKKVGLVAAGDSGCFQRVPMVFLPLPKPVTTTGFEEATITTNGAGAPPFAGRGGRGQGQTPPPDPRECQAKDPMGHTAADLRAIADFRCGLRGSQPVIQDRAAPAADVVDAAAVVAVAAAVVVADVAERR